MAMIDAATSTGCTTVASRIPVRQRTPGRRYGDGVRNAGARDEGPSLGAAAGWVRTPPFTEGVR